MNQEDYWAVISSYFGSGALVRQQVESFNDFLKTQVQEIIGESPEIVVIPEPQHMPGQPIENLVRRG